MSAARQSASDPLVYRHPRSLEEAFGPHTSRHITEQPTQPRMHPHDRAVLWASALAAVSLATMAVVAWI